MIRTAIALRVGGRRLGGQSHSLSLFRSESNAKKEMWNQWRREYRAYRDPLTSRIWVEQHLPVTVQNLQQESAKNENQLQSTQSGIEQHKQMETFYYDARTWETVQSLPDGVIETEIDDERMKELREQKNVKDPDGKRKDLWGQKPDFATEWVDPAHPEWVQYMELGSKRHYYFNRSTQIASWAPPSDAKRDIFREELEHLKRPLKRVPMDIVSRGAPIPKRLAAFGIDMGLCVTGGFVFGGIVYLELGNVLAAIPSVGMSTWVMYVIKDVIFERGTRSIGKRVMKLEIVKTDGQLPTRWNTAFRNVTVPVYLASTLLMPYIVLYAVADFGLFLFTPGFRRLGDWIGNTVVVPEQADRKQRMDEKTQREEEDDAKE